MFHLNSAPLGVGLPAMLLSTAAWADLTPEQVWGDWRQYMEGMGYEITASENAAGGTLTVSDLKMDMPMPEDGGEVSMIIGTLEFTGNGDGSVAIVMPDRLPLSMSATGTATDPGFTLNLDYLQTDHSIIVSGTPENMTYAYDAGTVGLKLTELIVDGKSYGEENAKIDVTASDFTSRTTMTIGDTRSYEQTGQIGDVTYDLFVHNPEQTGQLAMQGSMSDLTLEGTGTIPLNTVSAADMSAMIAAGFDMSGIISYGSGNTGINFQDEEEGDFASATSSQGGELSVSMGPDGIAYSGSQKDTKMNVKVADLPFPIDISMARAGFKLEAPVVKSDEAQDFALGLTLGDFVMSDMIWGIFDPTGQLPRDPATVELDLSGQAKLLVDYMDPEAAAQLAGPPGEVEALSVNTLVVDAAGARLEGKGDVTFDNSDMTTVPGMPKPVGAVDLSLAGGNGLLDKLVAMGLLPQDQAMGARMMMGLFAVPGGEPDTLTSKIEFTEDGQILANGQRIK
ncbi:hypothetical protein FIU94_06590 [Sulfitobacter sp. THAF37]|uniref:DUF2125 domain-containing protein n=1 Tax=Sulfitobacter sp. THAF37 TaxID=2587855 RepID=UPI001268A49A|nr:DUF2125 domain-containing protein [Sulfitobacter sp. THAF37]QFT58492.1 hypothetical protein FIU94_06590 [Sulfitobacter sp. THAF37]